MVAKLNEFQISGMSTLELKNVRRQTYDEMTTIYRKAKAEGRAMNQNEQAAYDALEDDLTALDREAEDRADGSNRPVSDPIMLRQWEREHGNDGTGFPNVLSPEQRFADLPNARAATEPGMGAGAFGQFVRGALTGRWDNASPSLRAMAEGTGLAGGYLVPTPLSATVIDKLRNQTRVIQAGAQTVPMTAQTLSMARVAEDPAATWIAENGDVAESAVTLERVQFEAQTLAVVIRCSRQLLDDGGPLFEQTIINSIAQAFAVKLDYAALYGSGTAPEPKGILNQSGLPTVSMGTNGAKLAGYAEVLQAIQKVYEANATPTAAIMAPRTAVTLAGLTASDNQPLNAPALVNALTRYTTSQMPTNETQGTANTASSIILGDFTALMIGMRQELAIGMLNERYADNLQVGFLAYLRADVQPAHLASFAAVRGIIPA